MSEHKTEEVSTVGRKWFDLTEEDIKKGRTEEFIISKCQEIWELDGTDTDAASHANISNKSLSRYLKAHPKTELLRDRLKAKPVMTARRTVVSKMTESYNNSMDYLSRKKKKEFGNQEDSKPPQTVNIINILANPEVQKATTNYEEILKKQLYAEPPKKIEEAVEVDGAGGREES
jgi:hypothetical protein|tara:strand:+ start:791 stop:1315 length:525 start_codon:yes stop_codon:yes gene_type:complete